MPTRVTGGFSVVNISNATDTHNVIKEWIQEDGDNIVNVCYNLWRYIRFSEIVSLPPTSAVAIAYDPPGEADKPMLGPSQQTAFDDAPLSSRSDHYQHFAVDWFAAYGLARYMRPRHFILDPTDDVLELTHETKDGHLPQTIEDIAALVCADPNLLYRLQCVQGDFDPGQLSSAAREACLAVFEDQESLEQYLDAPEKFISGWTDEMTPEERNALISIAKEQPELLRNAFDSIELGGAKGDGNTYILIGLDREKNIPNPEGLDWVLNQLENFAEQNGFLPSFGYYVTEAQSCHRIILGPGVTDRERDFLQFSGHELTDKRDGSALTERFAPPLEPGEPTVSGT